MYTVLYCVILHSCYFRNTFCNFVYKFYSILLFQTCILLKSYLSHCYICFISILYCIFLILFSAFLIFNIFYTVFVSQILNKTFQILAHVVFYFVLQLNKAHNVYWTNNIVASALPLVSSRYSGLPDYWAGLSPSPVSSSVCVSFIVLLHSLHLDDLCHMFLMCLLFILAHPTRSLLSVHCYICL